MPRPIHRPASVVIAVIALLVLTVPAFAAKPEGERGGGNQGSVKVIDTASADESPPDNEPHVCTFYLYFDGAPDGQSGSWSIVGVPHRGGEVVATGTYLIPAGGSYASASQELAAGHYRVNWQADGSESAKHKTFWVDDDCTADDPEELPTDEPAVDPPDEPEGGTADSVDEPLPPVDEPDPAEEQQPEPPVEPESDLAPATGETPIVDELPDTAMPLPVLPGLGAAAGLLLLIGAHGILRDRGRARC